MNTIQLIEVGTVAAIQASEVKVGDERLYNYHGTAVVIKIIEKSAKTLTFITCENGKYYMFDIRKSTLVAINQSGLDVSAHTPKEAYNTRKREMVNVSEYFPVVEKVTEAMEQLNMEQYHLELQERGMELTNSKPVINLDSTYKVIVSKDRDNNKIGEYETVLTGKELEFQLFMNEVLEIVEEITDQPESIETKLEVITIPEVTEQIATNQSVDNKLINNDITVHNNKGRNSVELSFDTKPSEEIRSILKAHKFRWSRKNSVWFKVNLTETDYNMIESLINSKIPYNSTEPVERANLQYPDINIYDIESYTIPQDIQDREHDGNWITRTTKMDHTVEIQKHFNSYNSKVVELLDITDNQSIIHDLKNSLQYFKKHYHETYIKWLSAKASQPSWITTGRGGMNINKYNKAMSRIDVHMHKLSALQDDFEKRINKAKKEIKRDEDIKIGEMVGSMDINITFRMKQKEFTYMGMTESRRVHIYKNYWIAKIAGCFRVFKDNKEIHSCKTNELLEHALKYVVYDMQLENQKAV